MSTWYRVSVSLYVKEGCENDAQFEAVKKLEQAGFDDYEIDFVDLAGKTHQVIYE